MGRIVGDGASVSTAWPGYDPKAKMFTHSAKRKQAGILPQGENRLHSSSAGDAKSITECSGYDPKACNIGYTTHRCK